MKKTRRRYDRDFKISVLAELEAGKPLAQIAREYGIHPSLPCRWKAELAENPEKAFMGNGNKYKDQTKIAEEVYKTVVAKVEAGKVSLIQQNRTFLLKPQL